MLPAAETTVVDADRSAAEQIAEHQRRLAGVDPPVKGIAPVPQPRLHFIPQPSSGEADPINSATYDLRPQPDRDRAALVRPAATGADAADVQHPVRAEQRMSQIPPIEGRTRSIPYHEMAAVKRRLLAGESRNSIARDYGCSGRQVSKLTVQYLHLEGQPVIPGLTRKIRAERGRRARAQFLQWARRGNAYEKAVVQEGRLEHARREAALALPREERLIKETPEQRDLRKRTEGTSRARSSNARKRNVPRGMPAAEMGAGRRSLAPFWPQESALQLFGFNREMGRNPCIHAALARSVFRPKWPPAKIMEIKAA